MSIWNFISYSIWLIVVISIYICYEYIFRTKTTLKLYWCKIFAIAIAIAFAILCNLFAM